MRRFFCILPWMLSLLTVAAACTVEPVVAAGEDGIEAGEPVQFTTCIPGAVTKALEYDEDLEEGFVPVSSAYTFTVEMFQKDVVAALGSGIYTPDLSSSDGTLSAATALYWPGNASKYAFKATAGTGDLSTDQSDEELFIAQDKLLGYGYEPLKDGDTPVDDIDKLNYRTSREWYAANVITRGSMSSGEYKKIPLYLKHQRSRITIILKAGEGVARGNLSFENARSHITTQIYSYTDGATPKYKTITPWASETTIDYVAEDFGGAADGVETTQYTCVVEPYDYSTNADTEPIARINLSGQHFTFSAGNDTDQSDAHMQNYNLTAGKHLIITAILGRESRKVVITAYVVDWDETVTTSIVDDYGQNGDPIAINSRQELYAFLTDDSRNKPGNVAIIVPEALNLEKSGNDPLAWDYTDLDLNCTLNMAGAVLSTNHKIFRNISSSGNLINGVVRVGNESVEAAICSHNMGTIEHVDVLAKDADGNDSSGYATRGGMVVDNSGTIVHCESDLPVQGADNNVVGGIAARSYYSGEGGTMPIIDGCKVNASVDGAAGCTGGGIVGQAVGRVTGNVFSYGITLLQNATDFKNSIHSKYTDPDHELRAYNNAWPTTATTNTAGGVPSTDVNLTPTEERYTAVIDCQAELAALLSDTWNQSAYRFRISNDFSVSKAGGWNYGKQTDITNESGQGNVSFQLYGDGHTITTDAMLFSNIMNSVQDITIRLGGDLIAPPEYKKNEKNEDVFQTTPIAPLAYAVCSGATIRNIQVKGGNYRMQAASVGGVVVWAYGGATIENCQCKANIQVWVPAAISDEARIYSGGIVATAADATITRCIFHNSSETLFVNTNNATNADHETAGSYNNAGAITTPNIFFGGILGGTAYKQSAEEYPSVVITDCTSWLGVSTDSEWRGSIVGYGRYKDAGSNLANGLEGGCQGNWWNTTSFGVGTGFNDLTDVQLLGKRNAVTPTADSSY